MSDFTYNVLTESLKRYLERGGVKDPEVLAQIPEIIRFGQTRLNREAKGMTTQMAVTSTMTPGQPIVTKPAYWRNTKSFSIGTGTGFNEYKTIFLRTYEYARKYASPSGTSAEPEFYADYDYEHFFVSPAPLLAYPFEVIEDDYVVPIDVTNQTNFWTKFNPDLLLHSCLLECQVFLKNREVVDNQTAYYDRLLKGVNYEDELRKMDRSQKGAG